MDLGIEGRRALVLGASQGLGRASAEALAREGAAIAVTSRDAGRARAVAAEIAEARGATVGGLVADTADLERMAELPSALAAELGGPPEILVLNSGGPPAGQALDQGVEEWRRAYEGLVLGTRAVVEAALPAMREAGWGRIVLIGSTSTIEPIPYLALSNVHRPAAEAFLMTLAREVAGEGITVNVVATGRFDTERLTELAGSREAVVEAARTEIPAARLGDPVEYGDLVAFLCSQRAAYITGAVIPIDGGLTRSS